MNTWNNDSSDYSAVQFVSIQTYQLIRVPWYPQLTRATPSHVSTRVVCSKRYLNVIIPEWWRLFFFT